VGKCCSNVLRSLIAYVVVDKTIRTRMCEKTDTAAHDARSTSTRSYIRMHDIPNTNTRTYHTQTRSTTRHLCEQAMYALTGVFGVRSCGQVLQQCAALPPRVCSWCQGCTHMCTLERASLTMRDPIHTTEYEVIYTHAYVYVLHVYLASFQYTTQ
jgi:hypothetical protein